jgi:hypothetical protein
MFKKDNRIGFKQDFRANKSSYLFGLPFTVSVFVTSVIGSVYIVKWTIELVKHFHVYVTTR